MATKVRIHAQEYRLANVDKNTKRALAERYWLCSCNAPYFIQSNITL
jgi:hypothetical protein